MSENYHYRASSKPNIIYWKVVAGEDNLSYYQTYDLIFDQKDLDLRFPPRNEKILKDGC